MANTFKPATLIHPITKDRVAVKTEDDAKKFFASNYELEKEPPASIKRTEAPDNARSVYDDLRKTTPTTKLMDYVKEGIKMKQGYNKDIQAGKAHWRTIQRDTSPFTDEAFRYMSPSEQSAVRASKGAAASAHLQGLREEEEYRGTRLSDTISALQDAKDSATAEEARVLDNTLKRLEIKRAAEESGYDYDEKTGLSKDYSSATAKSIANAIKSTEGGVSYDYKDPNRSEQGAYQFMPATWKEYSREYAGEVLKQSVEDFPMTPENQDAVVEYKIQKWLDAGYTPQQIAAKWNSGRFDGAEKVGSGVSTITGEKYDVPAYVDRFTKALEASSPTEVSAEEQAIVDMTGLTIDELGDLSDAELERLLKAAEKDLDTSLNTGYETDRKASAYAEIDKMIEEESAKGTDGSIIEAKLLRAFSPDVTSAEIKASMVEAGYKWDAITYTWIKQ